jgi:hypothetical protein
LGRKDFGNDVVHAERFTYFPRHSSSISRQQYKPVDSQRSHSRQRIPSFTAWLIAKYKTAEAPSAVGDPHLRNVPVIFRESVDAEILKQRFAPESGPLAIDRGDDAEARSLLKILRRSAHDSACQGLGDHGARDGMQ